MGRGWAIKSNPPASFVCIMVLMTVSGGARSDIMSKHENFIFNWESRGEQNLISALLMNWTFQRVFRPWQLMLELHPIVDTLNGTFLVSFTLFPSFDGSSSWTNVKRGSQNYEIRWKFFSCVVCSTSTRNAMESNFGVWSQLHMKIYKNLCSWQHWNVMNFVRSFFCKWKERKRFFIKAKNIFEAESQSDDDEDDAWKGKKGNQHKWFSILWLLPVYIHHGSGAPVYIRNMCFAFVIPFSNTQQTVIHKPSPGTGSNRNEMPTT